MYSYAVAAFWCQLGSSMYWLGSFGNHMKCIICDSNVSYFFSKRYTDPYIARLMAGVGDVNYWRCGDCGFVISRTHVEMSDEVWGELNYQFHHFHEKSGFESEINQPPYLEQAAMLAVLVKNDIVDAGSVLDYAAGYGSLSFLLDKYFGLKLPKYDPYVNQGGHLPYLQQEELGTYKTVINSAMFEHVRSRDDLDRVHELVASDGCMVIHTLVCESVPNDPDWFYLRPPVHTAFHTNKSMDILMAQWGFKSSIYCPQSKCWVLLRGDVSDVELRVADINQELQHQWLFCKNGFVDFWKGF